MASVINLAYDVASVINLAYDVASVINLAYDVASVINLCPWWKELGLMLLREFRRQQSEPEVWMAAGAYTRPLLSST
jgi:hypothetical protein